jgi:hypothetical protein
MCPPATLNTRHGSAKYSIPLNFSFVGSFGTQFDISSHSARSQHSGDIRYSAIGRCLHFRLSYVVALPFATEQLRADCADAMVNKSRQQGP